MQRNGRVEKIMNNNESKNYLGVIKGNKYITIILLIIGILITIGSVSVVKKNIKDIGYTVKIIEAEKNVVTAADRVGSFLGSSNMYKEELKKYETQKTKEYIYIFVGIFTTISGIALSVFMIYSLKFNLLNKENKIDG